MKNERVDKLIQLAWLEGWISTHGAYEKAIVKRNTKTLVLPNSRAALIERLESALAETKADTPLTVGALLRGLRTEHSLRSQEIFSRIGVTQNIYRMMEQDTVSPLKISLEVWKRLIALLNLSVDELAEMIRRTHQLVFFRPMLKGVLARYSSRKKKGMKTSILEKAYSEMYAKANLELPEAEQRRLNYLITTLKDETKGSTTS